VRRAAAYAAAMGAEDEQYIRGGLYLLQRGQLEEALVCFENALAANPDSAEAWYHKGCLLAHIGHRRDEALVCLDRSLALDSGPLDAWEAKAGLLGRLKRYDQTVACYDEVVARDGDYPAGHYWRAACLKELGRLEEAEADLDKAIGLDEEDPRPWKLRGDVRVAQGLFAAAVEDYARAVELDEYYTEARCGRASTLLAGRRYREVIEEVNALLAEGQDEQALPYLLRARAAMGAGNDPQALEDFDNFLHLADNDDPELPSVFVQRAGCCLRLHDYAGAWRDVKSARRLGATVDAKLIRDLELASGRIDVEFF